MTVNSDPPSGDTLTAAELFRLTQELFLAYDVAQNHYRAELEINDSDLRALNVVRAVSELSPGVLGRYLGLSSAGCTTMLDRLETAGFICRHPHPADRRRTLVVPGPSFPRTMGPGMQLVRIICGLWQQLDQQARATTAQMLRQTTTELINSSQSTVKPEK